MKKKSRCPVWGRQSGFTLLELMIIVVIFGVLATLAAPSMFNWIPRYKLKTDARQNLNYLRQARGRAVAENSQYGIYFDLNNRQLHFFKDTSNPGLATYEVGVDSLVESAVSMQSNVGYDSSSLNGNAVIFFPNGSASTSGSIRIRDTGLTSSYTISVLASTGRVKLQ